MARSDHVKALLRSHQRGDEAGFRRRSALRAHGVGPRSSLLLVGPPGCGKSASADAVAGQLGLPMAKVQLEASPCSASRRLRRG